ncbi:CDC45-like protein [Ditylenchus destructor]|nr:CDC45-like protein [Ditylenchus destructor]
MLIHENFRPKFYDIIRKEHTLVIVNADVDALAASTILTYALSCDDVTFSISPVDSWSAIEKAIAEHKDQVKNIVLINCGATRSLLDLNLPDEIRVFILDSHRPVHLDNIYNNDTIRVLAVATEIDEWSIPESSKIYAVDSDDEEDDENEEHSEEDDEVREDLATRIERRALKHQQKTNWKRSRGTLLWNYYMNTWHSHSSAVFMLELVHELGKASAEMMWCAAVGLSSQFTDQLISVENYTSTCLERMRPFIRKYTPKTSALCADDQLRISFDKELTLPLYSLWSLYKSMSNDNLFVCQSKLWTQKGDQALKHILAKLGLTLAECRQNYTAMSVERRKEVFQILEEHISSSFASFKAHFGYSTCYSSADFARILSYRLECPSGSAPTMYDRFTNANSMLRQFTQLGGRQTHELDTAFEKYKIVLQELTSLVFVCINQAHIISSARYYLANVHSTPAAMYLSSRHCLNTFAHMLLRAFASAKNAHRTSKPFILSVPLSEKASEWYLVTGIMPLADILSDTQRKSVIGRVFEQIAEESRIEVRREHFDSNIIMIRGTDRAKFFNSLETRLEIS